MRCVKPMLGEYGSCIGSPVSVRSTARCFVEAGVNGLRSRVLARDQAVKKRIFCLELAVGPGEAAHRVGQVHQRQVDDLVDKGIVGVLGRSGASADDFLSQLLIAGSGGAQGDKQVQQGGVSCQPLARSVATKQSAFRLCLPDASCDQVLHERLGVGPVFRVEERLFVLLHAGGVRPRAPRATK